MAITKKSARQEVVAARVTGTFGTGNDISALGTFAAIDVPANAIVVGGHLTISDATTATSDISIGDGVSTTRYISAGAADALATIAIVPTGYKYPAADTIDVTMTTAAPVDAGAFELVIMYIVEGRAAFTQG